MPRAVLVLVALAIAPTRADAHEPDPARRSGGYLHVAPVSVGTGFESSFGLTADAGWHVRGARRFAGGLLGGGVQFLLRRHVALGLEGGPQLGGEAWAQLRAHVFVGAWF